MLRVNSAQDLVMDIVTQDMAGRITLFLKSFHHITFSKMENQKLTQWEVVEIDYKSVSGIDGGKWIGDLGYACGSMVGHATNAAEMMNQTLKGFVEGLLFGRATGR